MSNHYNVLFLCMGNSARSVMAEGIMNATGAARFTAYSAGSHPSGVVRPEALLELKAAGISTDGLRSKSWDEFATPDASQMDFVFTVCDNAANEVCPVWPGHPATAHWAVPDPAAVTGLDEDIRTAFNDLNFIDFDCSNAEIRSFKSREVGVFHRVARRELLLS
jgi:arsenate reductase